MEAIIGSLTRFAVLTLVSDVLERAARLRVYIAQVGKRAQRPEVLAYISDGAFDLAFGEKRALQTVMTVEYKFSLSRIRSIH